jgi:tRNA(adenine34) deaminase
MMWMREALIEARKAAEAGDIPIGAVAVRDGQIVGRGHNCREQSHDPTAHAEVVALRQAAQTLGGWRTVGVTLYTTLEPCPMCAGAAVNARVPRIVWAADDPKRGAGGSVMDVLNHPDLNHHVAVTRGVLAEEATALLQAFFAELREKD